MKKIKLYQYSKCSSCKNAIRFLKSNKVDFELLDIASTPPSIPELKKMLDAKGGDLRKLFNTSGQLYRDLNIKDKINDFTEIEALKLLSENGMLIKRPFLLFPTSKALIGFNEDLWREKFKSISVDSKNHFL